MSHQQTAIDKMQAYIETLPPGKVYGMFWSHDSHESKRDNEFFVATIGRYLPLRYKGTLDEARNE